MKSRTHVAAREAAGGAFWGTIAEYMALPMGFVVFLYLTRALGPGPYGLYAIATSIVLWVEWTVTTMFDRALVKRVGETGDWRRIGAAAGQLYLLGGILAGSGLFLVAPLLARLLHEPSLSLYLRIYALDVPLTCLGQAHTNLLIGTAAYRRRAVAVAGRWVGKVVGCVGLVALGFSVPGAIVGNVFASLVLLVAARAFIRPPLFGRPGYPYRPLLQSAGPLFLMGTGLRLFDRLGLLIFKYLGGSAQDAGYYSSAVNMTIFVGTISAAYGPLLLSTLARVMHRDGRETATRIVGQSLRPLLWVMPAAVAVAASAQEVTLLLLGRKYVAAAPLLVPLILTSLTGMILGTSANTLVAAGRTTAAVAIAWPMNLLAVIGYLLIVPGHGILGTAWVGGGVSLLGAMAAVMAVTVVWQTRVPFATLARVVPTALGAWFAAGAWKAAGVLVVVKLATLGLLTVGLLFVLGEFGAAELDLLRSFYTRRGADPEAAGLKP